MATKTKAPTTKQVQIIARYYIKRNGHVCYSVKSSNGKNQYCTTLNAEGKATGCTCEATKKCYHMTGCENREAQRQTKQVATVAAPAVVEVEELCNDLDQAPAKVDTAIARPAVNVHKQWMDEMSERSALTAMQIAAEKAVLNGSSQGFSLMRR